MTGLNKQTREPFFNFTEAVPAYLAGVLIAIFTLVQIIPGLSELLIRFIYIRPFGAPYLSMPEQIVSLLGHGAYHGGIGHLGMNAAMIAILGIATVKSARLKSISQGRQRSPNLVFITIFIVGVIAGGLAQWLWWAVVQAPMNSAAVGASGGASALLATAGWAIGGKDKMFQFALGWALINVIMVVVGPFIGMNVAWAAHIGGFIGGMALAAPLLKANSTSLSL